jgi:uncharacterized protein (DUF952 family)
VLIYKILLPNEWTEFETVGIFTGSPFDHSSGFVHCSSRVQVGATALRVFPEEPKLIVAVIDAEVLGDAVRWESAADGGVFPHVYAPIPLTAVVATHEIAGAALLDDVLPPEP